MLLKDIFPGRDIVFIAEIGLNHNGRLESAEALLRSAAAAGADAVKFQTFSPEEMYSVHTSALMRGEKEGKPDYSQIEFFRGLTLREEEYLALSGLARELGTVFFSSPFDGESVELLESLQVPLYKVASSEVTNIGLLERIGATQKPVLLSTGMAREGEIDEAVNVLTKSGCPEIVVLHCVSLYPLPPEEVNLARIVKLRERYRLKVGFSDHSPDFRLIGPAVALGASVIEKHFTLGRDYECPDGAVSLTPEVFTAMKREAEGMMASMGDGHLNCRGAEEEVGRSARRSLFAREFIPRGKRIEKSDLIAKRPGVGMAVSCIPRILGKRVVADIEKDHLIRKEYLE